MRPLHPFLRTSAAPAPADAAAPGPDAPTAPAVATSGPAHVGTPGVRAARTAAPRPPAGAPRHAGRPGRPRSATFRLRCVIGVIGGVLWWGAVFRLTTDPGAAAPWLNALVAGGWGLGLIPLHAVPAHVRRPRPGGRVGRAEPDPAL